MSNEAQFDAFLGGNQELPSQISLLRFAVARSKEIIDMKNVLARNKSTKLAFQTLPKHMRRRCMSHNSKRLPRRLREIHIRQLTKSGMPPKQKPPSRKHRRRPKNLLNRQRTHKWLETHIWHAKRFHMTERWGYRLPDRPCDKSFRACYRATANHCLIQDISYYNCIELEGDEQVLVNKIATICDSCTGLSIGAKAYIKGNREGSTILFKKNSGTNKPIGTIYFHWKPSNDHKRILWLWIHAAFYQEAKKCLIECFNLTKEDSIGFHKNATADLCMKELKDDLNRIRLTGPLSNAILHEALIIAKITSAKWLETYSKNNKKAIDDQNQYWSSLKNITSTAQLSPHSILSLIISDPRYTLPKRRIKVLPQTNNLWFDHVMPTTSSVGPIWDMDIRKVVKENKPSNADIDNLRSNLLVPGSDLTEKGLPVPVMLIQRPGNRDEKVGYCSGWDIILPSGWTQSMWLSLIMYGAKPGGIRETNSIQFEQGKPAVLAPDTKAGEIESTRISDELKSKYFKRPPNKRVNYNKFAIACPFNPNWKLLVKEWGGDNEFTVLRDIKQLNTIQEILKSKNKKPIVLTINSLNYIVPIKLELKRGKPHQFAIICIPTERDLLKNNAPMEPYKEDENRELRKEIRTAHKNLLNQLGRKRKNARKDGKVVPPIANDMYADFNRKMRELWIPEPKLIKNSCAREIIGFVTAGDYSLTVGKGCGLGYITVGGLKTLTSLNIQNVLIRNTNSRQYRVASIEIAM